MTSVTKSDWLVELSRARSAARKIIIQSEYIVFGLRKYRKRDGVCQENLNEKLNETDAFVFIPQDSYR